MTTRWRKRKSITFVNEDRIKVTRENVSRQLLHSFVFLDQLPRREGEERTRAMHRMCNIQFVAHLGRVDSKY